MLSEQAVVDDLGDEQVGSLRQIAAEDDVLGVLGDHGHPLGVAVALDDLARRCGDLLAALAGVDVRRPRSGRQHGQQPAARPDLEERHSRPDEPVQGLRVRLVADVVMKHREVPERRLAPVEPFGVDTHSAVVGGHLPRRPGKKEGVVSALALEEYQRHPRQSHGHVRPPGQGSGQDGSGLGQLLEQTPELRFDRFLRRLAHQGRTVSLASISPGTLSARR